MAGSNQDKEIDLPELFKRFLSGVARMLRAIGRAFLISVVFLLRRWLPLTISIVLGIIVSILFWKTSESFYTSDLVLRINIEPADEVISYLNRLNTYGLVDNKARLGDALLIKNTENIRDIKAYWVIDNGDDGIPDYVDYRENHNVYDTLNPRMDDRVSIRVRIKKPQELNAVRDGIIKFINSDQLFQKRNELRLKQESELLARLEYDILQLDSLQKIKYFEENKNLGGSAGQLVFLQEQRTQLLYDDIYKLYDRKQDLETESSLYRDIVTVLSDFSIPAERDNTKFYYSIIFIPLFFAVTLVVLIIIANRRKLKEVYNRY